MIEQVQGVSVRFAVRLMRVWAFLLSGLLLTHFSVHMPVAFAGTVEYQVVDFAVLLFGIPLLGIPAYILLFAYSLSNCYWCWRVGTRFARVWVALWLVALLWASVYPSGMVASEWMLPDISTRQREILAVATDKLWVGLVPLWLVFLLTAGLHEAMRARLDSTRMWGSGGRSTVSAPSDQAVS